MTSLRTFRPQPSQPWDRARAAHLLRRTGFAPGEQEIQRALDDGLDATVHRLVYGSQDSERHDELDAIGDRLAQRNDINALRGWWLLRMRHTVRPLHARLSVFWHSHFATSDAKVRSAVLMFRQLRTLERLGAGQFEELLLAMSKDPAMIIWLDGNDNVKGRPNENYARELFELFGLGVGNYSENDIKEAARAFTGWHQKEGSFRFSALEHDGGLKRVFGRAGDFNGDDVVRAVIEHPACARFLATKLLREFLCPDPPQDTIAGFAQQLRSSSYDIAAGLAMLLSSEAMFDPNWRRVRIKSPVEYVIGLARSLRIDIPAADLATAVSDMGQRLFEPPSVKGWNGHREWINSTLMLVRLNAAVAAATKGAAVLEAAGAPTTAKEWQEYIVNLCLDGDAPASLRARLGSLTSEGAQAQALELVLSSPEYQMA